jgi:hypothetical protein
MTDHDLEHIAGMDLHILTGITGTIACHAADPVMARRIRPEAETIREARDRLTQALALLEQKAVAA